MISLTLALSLLLIPGPVPASSRVAPVFAQSGDRWLAEDKLQHAFASLTVVVFAYAGSRVVTLNSSPALTVAVSAGAVTGVCKELRDKKSGKPFRARDLVWDAVGIGASALLVSQARE